MAATHTTVIFAVIANHEHNFPFEHVIRNEAHRYPRNGVFGSLHGFELARKKAGGGGRGHGFLGVFWDVLLCALKEVLISRRKGGWPGGRGEGGGWDVRYGWCHRKRLGEKGQTGHGVC